MKGSRAAKRYMSRHKRHLNAICYDDLAVFQFERDRKWRKQNRRARDGSHGTAASLLNDGPDIDDVCGWDEW